MPEQPYVSRDLEELMDSLREINLEAEWDVMPLLNTSVPTVARQEPWLRPHSGDSFAHPIQPSLWTRIERQELESEAVQGLAQCLRERVVGSWLPFTVTRSTPVSNAREEDEMYDAYVANDAWCTADMSRRQHDDDALQYYSGNINRLARLETGSRVLVCSCWRQTTNALLRIHDVLQAREAVVAVARCRMPGQRAIF